MDVLLGFASDFFWPVAALSVFILAVYVSLRLKKAYDEAYRRKLGFLYLLENDEVWEVKAQWVSCGDIEDFCEYRKPTPEVNRVIEGGVDWHPRGEAEDQRISDHFYGLRGMHSQGAANEYWSFYGRYLFSQEQLEIADVRQKLMQAA